MKTRTRLILKLLYILSWIIFVGLCIEAGGFITNAIFALANPAMVKNLWHEVDLSVLLNFDTGHYFAEILILCIVAVLRASLFYLIIKILHDKKLDMARPFNTDLKRFINRASFLSLLIGLFSWYGVHYAQWLLTQGVKMPDAEYLRLGGADVWLFMSVILFVIAQIFSKGIDIQTENELTV